jgi:hypothetical protein
MYFYRPNEYETTEKSLIAQHPDYLDRKYKFLRWKSNYASKKVELIAKTNQEIASNIDAICKQYDIYDILMLNGHLLKYCESNTFESIRHYIFRQSILVDFPLAFQYTPESIRGNFSIALSIVKNYPTTLQFVSESLKKNKEFIEIISNYWQIPSILLDQSMFDQFPYSDRFIKSYNQNVFEDYDTNCVFDPYEDNEDLIYQILLKSASNARHIFSEKILFEPLIKVALMVGIIMFNLLKNSSKLKITHRFYFILQRALKMIFVTFFFFN